MSKVKGVLTFGLELETPTLTSEARAVIVKHGIRRWHDATVLADDGSEIIRGVGARRGGHELVLPPLAVLVECAQDGQSLKFDYNGSEAIIHEVCRTVPHVNKTCGLHVHLGRPAKDEQTRSQWEPERVRAWLAACSILEPKVYDLVPPSRRENHNCKKIAECYTRNELSSYYPMGAVKPHKRQNPKRYCWLNLIETRREGTRPEVGYAEGPATGTVEIRLLGNTARPDYIWAWVKFWLAVSALVAYTPTSLAILHSVALTTLGPYYDEVYKLKLQGNEL